MEEKTKMDGLKEKAKIKWNEAKIKGANMLRNTSEWVSSHRDDLIWMAPLGAAIIKGGSKITAAVVRNHAVNKEIYYRKRQIYDRSLGRYITLKRPLTDAEALLIETRRRNGEGLTTILYSMKLIK